MVDKREKTLSYRRAVWFDEASGLTLEKCLREAHKNLKNIGERTIVHGDQHTCSAKQKDGPSGGMFLHLTADTPGEYASVVPKVAPSSAELDLKTAGPPPDGEWLDGDAFLFVRHDHVCMCATGIRDGAINYFLHKLFEKAKLRKDSARFELEKVADVSKLKMLHSQGVQEVEIRATMYQATADYERRKGSAFAGLGAAGRYIKAFLKKPNDYTPDGLQVTLSLKADKRFKKDFRLGEKRIEQIAADVVKNAEKKDEYSIITKTGQKISAREIFMRTTVQIDSDGKTVDRDKAWRELSSFYKFLSESGALEQ